MSIFKAVLLIAGLSLFFPTFSIPAQDQAPLQNIPSQQFLQSRIKKTHPRLLVTLADFARVKKLGRENDLARRWYDALRLEGQKILGEMPSAVSRQGKGATQEASRTTLRRVQVLALLHRVEGGSRYAHRLWQELDTAAKLTDWHPNQFLDTAEMTLAFALAYDWMYDFWSAEQRAALAKAIVDQGLKPALQAYQNSVWWVRSPFNWNLVCNGCIGLGALAVFEDAPEPATKALQEALRSLPPALAKFSPDGGGYEGPMYWGYATFYSTLFMAGLETALGENFGLPETPGYGATGFFPLYLTGPQDKTFNYADSNEKFSSHSQMFWLACKFRQPVFAWYPRHGDAVHPLDLLWFEAKGPSPKEANLPLDRYFRGVEVATFRSAWDDPQAIFLGFKGGDNKAGHAHLDLGSFVLDAQGVRWAMDLGWDNYDLPGYFGDNRWDYYRLRAEGHNTLVLNPRPGPDQDPGAAAGIIRFRSDQDRSLAVADLTPAYPGQAQRVWRGVSLLSRRQVLVQDEIQAEKPAEVWWAMHTPAEVKLSQDKKTAQLSQGKARLEARILSPPEAVFTVQPARPSALSPHPPGQSVNLGVSKLAIRLENVKDLSLAVLFNPVPGEEKNPPPAPESKITPLAQW